MDEDQYYNPIISTYLKVKGMQQEQAQHAALLQQRQVEEANRQKQETEILKQAQQRIDQEHELHQMQADIAKSHLDLANREAAFQTAQHLRDMISGGVSPEASAQLLGGGVNQGTNVNVPTQTPGEPPLTIPTNPPTAQYQPQTLRIPGIANPINMQGIPGPADILAQQAQAARTLSGAKAEGELPAELTKLNIEGGIRGHLQEQENQFKAGQQKEELASKERLGKLERDTQILINGSTNAARMGVAHIEHDISPDQMQSGVIAALTGQRKFSSDNIFDRNVMSGVQAMGGRLMDPKDAQTLQQMQSLNQTFDKVQTFINKYLPDESTGSTAAKIKAYAQGKITGTTLPTDARNEMMTIKTDAINTGRALEGLTGGRVTQQQIGLMLDGLVNPGVTKQQGQQLLNSMQNNFINKEENQILGGMPDAQKKLIYKTYGITPGFLKFAPKKNISGHELDEDKSIELGQPVYK